MRKKNTISEDELQAELSKYLGTYEPPVPAGKGFTLAELSTKSGLSLAQVRSRVEKQIKSGLVRRLGIRQRVSVGGPETVYEAV